MLILPAVDLMLFITVRLGSVYFTVRMAAAKGLVKRK